MKNTALLIGVALLGLAAPLRAQNLQAGLAGGVTISSVDGDDTEGAESRTSMFGGGSLVWQSANAFGFEMGLLYVSKGSDSRSDDIEATLQMDYIEIPLLARMQLAMGTAAFRPYLAVGGSIGLNIACSATLAAAGVSLEEDCEHESFEGSLDIKEIDLGVSGAIGADMALGERFILSPSVRYTRGISEFVEDADVKNSAFQIGVAARLVM